MAYDFSANDMFELALRIEENGARFYRKASEKQTDERNRDFLEKLAVMEEHHKKMFAKMQSQINAAEKTQTVFDPENESLAYLAAMADRHGGEGSPSAAEALSGDESIEEIIDIAIGLEKESILFYVGMKDYVPPKYGRDKIDTIIAEERKHVIQLDQFRKSV